MTALRRPVRAMVVMLAAAASVLSLAAPSLAAPPFPAGAQATALVGGTPLIRVVCPAGSPGAVAGGVSTKGGVSVGSPAGARCTPFSASADGLYAIAGETPPLPGTLRFSASCDSASGATGTAVDVPAGTNVAGIGVVPQQTTVTTLNTMVTYPNGTTAIVNEVITTPTSVTRNAIRITSGPNAGTIIGQVVCGSIYPLAVDAPSGAAGTPAVAAAGTDGGGSRSGMVAIAVAALGVLLIAQLAIGRRARRTRA
jgi:hypothetical protein